MIPLNPTVSDSTDSYAHVPARRVRVPAAAKVNLGLHICGLRADGYHVLNSLVAPIRVFDMLNIYAGPRRMGAAPISICCEPANAAPQNASNLAWKAAALYCRRAGVDLAVEIMLCKGIPSGGGFGGGSSDAAATLRGLNALSPRPIPGSTLSEWALELGADVPFFLYGKPARMGGVGEVLEPVSTPSLRSRIAALVVVFPGVGLSTAEVYGKFDGSLTREGGESMVCAPSVVQGSWRTELQNDLEPAATSLLPELKELKREFRALGARHVAMTGSGSGMFGIWNRGDDARAAAAWFRARGVWARATGIVEQLPAIEMDDAT